MSAAARLPRAGLQSALLLVRQAADADTALLLMPGKGPETLRVAERHPADGEGIRTTSFPAGAGLPGAALLVDAPVASPVGAAGAALCPYRQDTSAIAHAMAVALPGRSAVLVLERYGVEPFDPDHLGRMEGAAGTLAWFLDAADAFELAEGRATDLRLLNEAADELSRADDIACVSAKLVAAARALVPVDLAVVSLREDDATEYCVVHVEGAPLAVGARYPDGAWLAPLAGRLKRPLPASGRYRARFGSLLGPSLPLYPRTGDALAILPLVSGSGLVGTLVLVSHRTPRYGADRLSLLRSLANLAGAELGRRRLEEQLKAQAETDPLTGLANRRAFSRQLRLALERSQRYGHPTSLLMVDVDHFKQVNDVRGHAAGDDVLRGLGGLLRKAARSTDLPARLGGEEFAVILEHTDTAGAITAANRLREAIAARPFADRDTLFHVTASIGVATYVVHASAPEALVAAADAALYDAKRTGRNRVNTPP